MSDFSVGEAISTGIGLIARRPLAVLLWGLLPVIVFLPLVVLFIGTIAGMLAAATQAGTDQQAVVQAILPGIGGIALFVLIAILVAWVIGAVTTAAAFRAVLHPEQSAFGYLRFGSHELLLMLVGLVMGLVFFGVSLACQIPTSIIQLSLMSAPRGVLVTVVVLLGLARQALIIWLWVRLCMAFPMTFAEGRFRLFESWAVTRGHALKLFGWGVLTYLIIFAAELVLVAVCLAAGFGFAGAALGGLQGDPTAVAAHFKALLPTLAPLFIIAGVGFALLGGASVALLRAPLAYIYRALVGVDVAQTFT